MSDSYTLAEINLALELSYKSPNLSGFVEVQSFSFNLVEIKKWDPEYLRIVLNAPRGALRDYLLRKGPDALVEMRALFGPDAGNVICDKDFCQPQGNDPFRCYSLQDLPLDPDGF